jgi:hypothetical protein
MAPIDVVSGVKSPRADDHFRLWSPYLTCVWHSSRPCEAGLTATLPHVTGLVLQANVDQHFLQGYGNIARQSFCFSIRISVVLWAGSGQDVLTKGEKIIALSLPGPNER